MQPDPTLDRAALIAAATQAALAAILDAATAAACATERADVAIALKIADLAAEAARTAARLPRRDGDPAADHAAVLRHAATARLLRDACLATPPPVAYRAAPDDLRDALQRRLLIAATHAHDLAGALGLGLARYSAHLHRVSLSLAAAATHPTARALAHLAETMLLDIDRRERSVA